MTDRSGAAREGRGAGLITGHDQATERPGPPSHAAEADFAAHDAGYVVDDIEEGEAMTDACSGCGATKGDDGWTWHPSDCPIVALSPEGKRIVNEKVESVRQARLAAMESAHGYAVG